VQEEFRNIHLANRLRRQESRQAAVKPACGILCQKTILWWIKWTRLQQKPPRISWRNFIALSRRAISSPKATGFRQYECAVFPPVVTTAEASPIFDLYLEKKERARQPISGNLRGIYEHILIWYLCSCFDIMPWSLVFNYLSICIFGKRNCEESICAKNSFIVYLWYNRVFKRIKFIVSGAYIILSGYLVLPYGDKEIPSCRCQ